MKTCSKCNQAKQSYDFAYNKNAPDKRSYWCRECVRVYDFDHLRHRLDTQNVRTQANRKWVQELKTGPCVDCGDRYPPEILQFDHKPEYVKVAKVSGLLAKSRVKILEEISKCDLVCPTCHALRTHNRRLEKLDK